MVLCPFLMIVDGFFYNLRGGGDDSLSPIITSYNWRAIQDSIARMFSFIQSL